MISIDILVRTSQVKFKGPAYFQISGTGAQLCTLQTFPGTWILWKILKNVILYFNAKMNVFGNLNLLVLFKWFVNNVW